MSVSAQHRQLLWFPLLGKELVEKANRLRSYWIRTLYTYAFIGFFGYQAYQILESTETGAAGSGSGGHLFQQLFLFELLGAFLFTPILLSGLIAYEKERGTLALLLTTDLSPSRIVLQKYLGGLVPMVTLQVTALPVAAVAYTLGGVSVDDIWYAGALLTCHTLHAGAFCIACSCWCRSSAGAFALSCIGGSVWFALIAQIFTPEIVLSFPIPATALERENQLSLIQISAGLTILLLLNSSIWLRRRMDVSSGRSRFRIFNLIDRAYQRINRSMGNVSLADRRYEQPEMDPISWRELRRRALGQPSHVVRLTVGSTCVVVAVIAVVVFKVDDPYRMSLILRGLCYVFWGIYLLILVSLGSGIVASDRAGQTLDVLLTTPAFGWDILGQKSAVALRTSCAAVGPLGTCYLAIAVLEQHPMMTIVLYLGLTLLMFLAVSFFCYWFASAIGLVMRRWLPSLLVTVLGIVVLTIPAMSIDPGLTWFSPIAQVVTIEAVLDSDSKMALFRAIFQDLALIGLMACVFSWYCAIRADVLLGRAARDRLSQRSVSTLIQLVGLK